jgi:phosphoserine aminotransferase
MLYDVIDSSSGFYSGRVNPADRSKVNVVFNLATPELEKKFLVEAGQEGLIELKGHRAVGGCRASLYNAMPTEGVVKLRDFMKKFKDTNQRLI